MKDTVITRNRKIIEIITLITCFIIAFLVNVYAIIAYDGTSWSELFMSLGYVSIFTVVLYVTWSVIRIVFYCLKRIFIKKKRR